MYSLDVQAGKKDLEEAHLLSVGFEEHHIQAVMEDLEGDSRKPGAGSHIQGRAGTWQPQGGQERIEQVFDEDLSKVGDAGEIGTAVPFEHEEDVFMAQRRLLRGKGYALPPQVFDQGVGEFVLFHWKIGPPEDLLLPDAETREDPVQQFAVSVPSKDGVEFF